MKPWSNLANIVTQRTYSRKDEFGNKEKWKDIIIREIEGNVRGRNVPESEIRDLLKFGMERKSIPAGRGLWFSGTEAHRQIGGVALNNCFSGKEKFITKERGSISFEEIVDEEVTVATHFGWKKATVRYFGEQNVQDVVFSPADRNGKRFRSNHRVKVRVTPNHGWFLKDGTKTTCLKKGDIVQSEKVPLHSDNKKYENGVLHGLIFGDGTKNNVRKDGTAKYTIRFCKERTKKHIALFKDITYPDTYGGDAVGRTSSFENLKNFPVNKDCDYLAGFLEGWLAADGNFSELKGVRLSSQNPDALLWLQDNAVSCGYILSGYSSTDKETSYGKRRHPLFTFTLRLKNVTWKVESIFSVGKEKVYCAVVPDVQAFTLSSGLYTSNCWYLNTSDWYNFVICQDLLMLGGGVGASVEHRFTSKLPKVKSGVVITHKATRDADFIIPDSREGWGELTYRVLEAFFSKGKGFTYSTICLRHAGEAIKGFGGTASGPQPLVKFVQELSALLIAREGKFIRTVDAADIITLTAAMVVAGNVRRSAIIILGDPWDKEYLRAKRWDLGLIPNHRSNANYSVVVDDAADLHPLFWQTFEAGEAFGIVNRTNIRKYGRMGELKKDTAEGVNPCSEACLEPFEPCNLQEIALPNLESEEEFIRAGQLMHRYGKRVTLEKYHHEEIQAVIDRNRRIGTGITGCLASPLFNPTTLDRVYAEIQKENVSYSKELGIPESIRTTVVKPSGTVSKLLDMSGYEGIHSAYSEYIIQRIRIAAEDHLIPLLRDAGHHIEPEIKLDGSRDQGTLVVDFYMQAPEGAPVADKNFDTWKQLDTLKLAQKHWADQAVSVSIYYKRQDISKIKQWLTDNIDEIKTISFLCHDEHGFVQAPKEAISKEQYERLSAKIKPIDVDMIGDGYDIDIQDCAGGMCPVK